MSGKTLVELYRSHSGKVSDKWSSYLPVYEEKFAPMRERKVRLLEIGIQNGGSLEIYSRYFPVFESLVGCDINPDCEKLHYQDPRIRVVVGDANTDEIEKRILDISDAFDIILDDGSHVSADIIRTFARYWKHVRPGGIFIAEDLHCSYWQDYGGGLYDPLSSISFFKALADIIHEEHWGVRGGPGQRLEKFARFYGLAFDDEELQKVHAVEFFNSQCVIRKEPIEKNRLGRRMLAGQESAVIPTDASLHGSAASHFDQSANAKTIETWQLPETRLQLFFSSTGGFSEKNSAVWNYICGDPQRMSLALPQEAQGGDTLFLRLDPTDRPGLVLLRQIRLKGRRKEGGEITTTFHAGDIVPAGDLLALADPAGSYLSTGNDPALLLAAVPSTGVVYESLEVEIGFRLESSAFGVPIRSLHRSVLQQGETVDHLVEAVKEVDNRSREEMEKLRRENADFSERQTLAIQRLGEAHASQETRLTELAVYLGAIQDLAADQWLNYMPAPLSWPFLLFKARGIKRPQWFPSRVPAQSHRRSGFWRRLEKSIRKRRKRWTASWGFNASWYLKSYPEVERSGLDPLDHYVLHGRNQGLKKNAHDRPKIKLPLPVGRGYADWVRHFDTLTDEDRIQMQKKIKAMGHRPILSILMPVHNPRPDWLRLAIESVRRQIYPHWQLCLADDASTDPEVLRILEKQARIDPRIVLRLGRENGDISRASNEALALAQGEWVTFLDHDDELKEDALFWVAQAIQTNPEAALLYSDEDKIGEDGNRRDPHFKPEWNPSLLLSYNYFCHLLTIRKDLVEQVGGFREGFEGAQDYDLVLRCLEKAGSQSVLHIPKILYHWRMHALSTSAGMGAKPRAEEAGRRAIAEHLNRRGISGLVSCVPGGYRVEYELAEKPKVSILIPTRDQAHLLRQCVESLLRNTVYPNYEILLIDNGSEDPDAKNLLLGYQAKGLKVIRDEEPFNYSRLNNLGSKMAQGSLLLLLNNDVEAIDKNWLENMVRHICQPGVGAVGAKLLYPDGTNQHCGVIIGLGGVAGHSHKRLPGSFPGYFHRAQLAQDFTAVTAACLLVRKEVFFQAGGLDADHLPVAFNDVDLCLKIREAGWRVVWTPFAELIHHESASRGQDESPEKQARFASEIAFMKSKWGDKLLQDPHYSPNLTLDDEIFSLAFPPRLEAFWKI